MTKEEFIEWLQGIPEEDLEPFCPFSCAYCNSAYSMACYECEFRIQNDKEE